MYSSEELFQHSRECYFGEIFWWFSAETVRHESAYIILFFTWHNKSINNDKNVSIYMSSQCLTARFSFCWWCNNRLLMKLQWPDNCYAITWIVISNSLDIDFIHSDIHGRLCKKLLYQVYKDMAPVLRTWQKDEKCSWHSYVRMSSAEHSQMAKVNTHQAFQTV